MQLLRHVFCQLMLAIFCQCMSVTNLPLPEGSTWKVGVFRNDNSLPSDENPKGNLFVFDEKCNVSIVFHEVYQELQVAICRQVDQMKANFRTLHITNICSIPFFNKNCELIKPHLSPVINNYEGPILLVVQKSSVVYIKDRNHLREDPGLTFNATYELRLKSITGMSSHIDPSMVADHISCETNGIPYLVARNETLYEFKCNCKYSTYGQNCEWGPLCPKNKRRELCSFNGSCKQRGDIKTCTCDSEKYHGSNCIHFSFFPFYNCCGQRKAGTCCHKLPTKTKCCPIGFLMSEYGYCVEEKQKNPLLLRNSIIKSITSNQKNEILEMCCYSCERDANFTFYKDNHTINEIPVNMQSIIISSDLTVWKRNEIEIIKLTDGSVLDSMLCLWIRNYSQDDFGLYSCNVQTGNVNETQEHLVSNKETNMRLSPRKLTVFKGNDLTMKCRIRGTPLFESEFKFNWTVSSVSNFESWSTEPYFFQGSDILIKNIQGDLNVECYANEDSKQDMLYDSYFQ